MDFRIHVTEGILITKAERLTFTLQAEREGKLSEVEPSSEHSLSPQVETLSSLFRKHLLYELELVMQKEAMQLPGTALSVGGHRKS